MRTRRKITGARGPLALLLAGALLLATAGTSGAALLWENGFDNASSVPAVGGRHVEFPGGAGWTPGKRGA